MLDAGSITNYGITNYGCRLLTYNLWFLTSMLPHACYLLDQPLLHRFDDGFGFGVDMKLVVDVIDVAANRAD